MGTEKPTENFSAWIEQDGAIHVKAATEFGDPIEISAEEARAISETLRKLAEELDRLDGSD